MPEELLSSPQQSATLRAQLGELRETSDKLVQDEDGTLPGSTQDVVIEKKAWKRVSGTNSATRDKVIVKTDMERE